MAKPFQLSPLKTQIDFFVNKSVTLDGLLCDLMYGRIDQDAFAHRIEHGLELWDELEIPEDAEAGIPHLSEAFKKELEDFYVQTKENIIYRLEQENERLKQQAKRG